MTTEEIPVSLPQDQALVLFEWLARTGAGEQPAEFEDHPGSAANRGSGTWLWVKGLVSGLRVGDTFRFA